MAKKSGKSSSKSAAPIVNRRARFDYELGDEIVTGLVLTGSETRAARDGHIQLKGAFVSVRNNELWLNNASFSLKLNERGKPGTRTIDTEPSDYVDEVVVTAPTGFGGVHPEQMVWSLLREALQRPATEHARDVVIEALEYTVRARHNLVHKIRVARNDRVMDEARTLIAQDIPITAVRYLHDMLVHFDEVGRGLAEAGVDYSFDVQANHAGHNSHLLHPQLVSAAVTNAIMSQADGAYTQRRATLLRKDTHA